MVNGRAGETDEQGTFPGGSSIRGYLLILRRRKWWFLLPAVLVLAVATGVASLWPPTFRSEATILIEDAEIPEDVITPLIGDYVEKRLETIDRRVMTTDSLLGIIQRYDLYPAERKLKPLTEIVEQMREDMGREMIRANVVDPKSGQRRNLSVAFKLHFDYGDAGTAQRITNELVTLYLNENLRQRRQLTGETANFLRQERQRVDQQIAEIGSRLAAFKQENGDALPERLPYNQQLLARAEQERRDLDRQIQSLKERESYLAAQLAQLDPNLPAAQGGAMSPAARLETMRATLASLTARYGEGHPDVVHARRELEVLERSVGTGGGRRTLEPERERLAAELALLRERYSDDHPDVRRAERELAAVENALRVAGPGGTSRAGPRPDNPAYITLQAQLAGIRTDLQANLEQRGKVEADLEAFQRLLLRTPQIEGEYAGLQRQLADAMALRNEIAQKETAARLGQAVESELKAERLALIEPPSLPPEPARPNRKLLLALGLVLAIGGGGGAVALRQLFDDAIWTSDDVVRLLGAVPLALVPRIRTRADRARRWAAAGASLALVLAMLGGGVWWMDQRYGPLDIYAYELQRRALQTIDPYLPDTLRPWLGAERIS